MLQLHIRSPSGTVPPDTGSIGVASDPAGAEIFINNADTGFATPYTFTGKVVGSYDVYVTKSGYVTPEIQTKSVTKDATTSYSFTLSAVPPVIDILFDGPVNLAPDTKFTLIPYNNLSASYQVNSTTPLGALDSFNKSTGIRLDVTDSSYGTKSILMVDNIGNYLYSKSAKLTWICQVNGVTLDDFGVPSADGLNIKSLTNGDQVNFYYGMKPVTPENATAVVKIKVNIGGTQPTEPDWTLSLNGAKTASVTKTLFEQGLACPTSGHQVFWTDTDGDTWGGVPLWLLVAMVDDNPDIGPDHYNFNDSIAAQGYSVKVVSGDGWDTTLASADIARNDSYIVANTLNGQPLSILTPGGKLELASPSQGCRSLWGPAGGEYHQHPINRAPSASNRMDINPRRRCNRYNHPEILYGGDCLPP